MKQVFSFLMPIFVATPIFFSGLEGKEEAALNHKVGAPSEKQHPSAGAEAAKKEKENVSKAFTGKIVGNKVRMRLSPDLESNVIAELTKDDLVVVRGEKGDFYAVEPPSHLKAYIFRGFVINNVVEGDRVNVRLSPDREAPVVGHYSSGDTVHGEICAEDSRWLTIPIPSQTNFYIAKEYIEYAGNIELKKVHDKRKQTVTELLDSATLLSQSEMLKPFNEIDIERISQSFQAIASDYADFPKIIEDATKRLSTIQEEYLHKKVSFLESKGGKLPTQKGAQKGEGHMEPLSPTDRMKVWEPIEESLYLTWSTMHHAKTMEDFYKDQKLKGKKISGILELYKEPVKNKPGDYLLKDKDLPVAYLYSTHLNLEEYVGKRVEFIVAPRQNNNFAFPAYYVLDANE